MDPVGRGQRDRLTPRHSTQRNLNPFRQAAADTMSTAACGVSPRAWPDASRRVCRRRAGHSGAARASPLQMPNSERGQECGHGRESPGEHRRPMRDVCGDDGRSPHARCREGDGGGGGLPDPSADQGQLRLPGAVGQPVIQYDLHRPGVTDGQRGTGRHTKRPRTQIRRSLGQPEIAGDFQRAFPGVADLGGEFGTAVAGASGGELLDREVRGWFTAGADVQVHTDPDPVDHLDVAGAGTDDLGPDDAVPLASRGLRRHFDGDPRGLLAVGVKGEGGVVERCPFRQLVRATPVGEGERPLLDGSRGGVELDAHRLRRHVADLHPPVDDSARVEVIDDGGVRAGIVTADDGRLQQPEAEHPLRLLGFVVESVSAGHLLSPGVTAGHAGEKRGQQQDQEQRNGPPT